MKFIAVGQFRYAGLAMIMALSCSAKVHAQSPICASGANHEDLQKQVEQLRSIVLRLSARIDSLQTQLNEKAGETESTANTVAARSTGGEAPNAQPAIQISTQASAQPTTKDDSPTRDFLQGTTLNLTVDGYYAYNFNRPTGRVNLLRAYDVSSNSFSLNQATVVLERAPDATVGRRLGARLDLQFGQATETLQGSAANELRPQTYRPVFQAYGTFIFPLGSGLTVDFGKWASALGVENNYGKDQISYSRSYFFNFLPFYHTGVRATYNLTPKIGVSYWLVNGAQQTEDFNGFKSQAFIFTLKPTSTVSWNVNYYFGQEQRDVLAILNPGIPTSPTQPGLPVTPITPTPNGREHIFDSYVTWNVTPRWTFAAEGDYVVNRLFSNSTPGHVSGGAGYGRYQVTPKFAVAARVEYLSDHGGLFSGRTQALKETTVTTEYKFADGFLARWEWRRDFSNQPFFLTETPGLLKREQNTATVGLIWWWGQKQGAW